MSKITPMLRAQRSLILLCGALAGTALWAQPQIGGATCSNATLNNTYEIAFASRQVTNGTFGAVQQQVGTVVFDGNGNATFNTTVNSNTKANQPNAGTGTYSLNANCDGTLTEGSLTFNLIVYELGSAFPAFTITGNNGGQVMTGSGTVLTTGCQNGGAASFVFNANGFGLNGTTVTAGEDLSGLFQTDGMGNVTATWTVSNGASSTTVNVKGQYSLGSNCQGSITVLDSINNVTYVFSFAVVGNGNNFNFIASSPSHIFMGAGHLT